MATALAKLPCLRHACLQKSMLANTAWKHVCAPVSAKKGKQQGNVKVNKRGKVSSRPGPGNNLMEEAQQTVVQQLQGAQQADTSATPPAPAAAAQQQQQQQQLGQLSAQSTAANGLPQSSRRTITETPQVVVDRMFKRVITFAGAPVLLGTLLFPLFWYLKVVQKLEYPLWVVYVTQAVMFGGGLLGITYGILSTSWDPKREGSALGWTELQANLPILLNKNKQQD